MSVIVLSCGRTGTNVALECLRGSAQLNATKNVEDKELFNRDIIYSSNYLSKMDTTYIEYPDLEKLLNKNPNMKVIWTIRDPRDVCISKIYRGQPYSEGRKEKPSEDSTPIGAEESLRHMLEIYKLLKLNFPTRVQLVKLENLLSDTEETVKAMCEFINVKYDENMLNFPDRMRNKHKKNRYGSKIDKNQIALWKNWSKIYNGFFIQKNLEMEELFDKINDITKYFEYI